MSLKMITFCMILVLVSSCGFDRGYIDRSPADELASPIVAGGRGLTEDEMKVAVRICFAYRTKRNNFNTILMGNTFNFSLTRTTCGLNVSTVQVVSTLAQEANGVYFKTDYVGEFSNLVETDISGFLSPLCDKVIRGDVPVNYYEVNNEAFEVSFTALSPDNDRFTVKIGNKSGQNVSTTRIIEHDVVVSNGALGSSLMGLTSRVTRFLRCNNDPSKFDSLSKTYLP